MKRFWLVLIIFWGSLLRTACTLADTAPLVLLQQMKQASQTLNYDMSFINVNPQQGVESMRYRHGLINDQPVAQLLQMDGSRREVIQRGNRISYFEPGVAPFTLSADYIVDSLPALLTADFQRLSTYYDFIPMGRARIADSLCEVVRVASRDALRYGYVVWLDMQTNLPLRVDLLDGNGDTLEQFRVIEYRIDKQPNPLLGNVLTASLPPLLVVPPMGKQNFTWQPGWLPAGFRQMSSSHRQIAGIESPVESRLYSDGLFSFSLNIARASNVSANQLLRNGRRTVSSQVKNNVEITVVGELPPATARRIADNIKFGR